MFTLRDRRTGELFDRKPVFRQCPVSRGLHRRPGHDGLPGKACRADVSAINVIDLSALESLEAINHRLATMDVKLHMSEVKGPVMDRLKKSHFLDTLTGQVLLSQFDAWAELTPNASDR
jgi:MFS superfamily sulfate permease-like transporter